MLVEALIDHEINGALMSTPPADNRLHAVTIGDKELLAAVPARWATVSEGLFALASLGDQPAVVLDEVHCLGQQMEAFCPVRKPGPRVVCRTTQLATILQMVSLGLGFSLVPEMTAAADPTHHGRRYVHLVPTRPRRPIVLVWRTGRTRSKASGIFLASLRETFSRVP